MIDVAGNPATCDASLTYYATCFIADTQVTLINGTKKSIQDVKIGDVLKGETTNNTVLGFHRPELNGKLYSFNGGKYFVTEEHPFKTIDGWKSINPEKTKDENIGITVTSLHVGDTLVTDHGDVLLKSMDSKSGKEGTELYNFILSGDHTYFADGYLVHNKEQCIQPDGSISCSSGNNFCVNDGQMSYSGGLCPMNCNSSSYRNGSNNDKCGGFTSVCIDGTVQCMQSSCLLP